MKKNILILALLTNFLFADFSRDSIQEVVIDDVSNLTWQDDFEVKTDKIIWSEAVDYCENLTLGGYSNWRLPNINELKSIVDLSKYNPSINSIFENIVSGNYWSSTSYAEARGNAWYIYFANGSHGGLHKSGRDGKAYVRCVRDMN
ncbi:hypothetical protein GCM10012288_07650 [Malaciobacter pacificus]|uniref:Lcl C-terminal domain-containing protein n=1 Tax=Malaciobacter pacificus TaxID=1080223 RepID=UPI00102A90D4|nr:DUF1566 domain-containing protein [Malaciobacter pacificus]GGD36134.1 hypothetical protein GCM10012288_07650 [Malaciobacter pacificus]